MLKNAKILIKGEEVWLSVEASNNKKASVCLNNVSKGSIITSALLQWARDNFSSENGNLENSAKKTQPGGETNPQSDKSCDYCADPSEAEHNICEACLDRLIRDGA